MVTRNVTVGDDFTLPTPVKVADTNLPDRLQDAELAATYVTFVDDTTGLPLVGKHVTITVNATTNDITDILVEDI